MKKPVYSISHQKLGALLRHRQKHVPRGVAAGHPGAQKALAGIVTGAARAGLHGLFGAAGAERQAQPHNGQNAADNFQGQNSLFSNEMLEASIDRMVAASLVHGKQTSGVMRVLFGLVPSLIGR